MHEIKRDICIHEYNLFSFNNINYILWLDSLRPSSLLNEIIETSNITRKDDDNNFHL